MKALNYAARAAKGLMQLREGYIKRGFTVSAPILLATAMWLVDPRTQHFMLPASGTFFEDGLKGLYGGEVRKLPYPNLTLEYNPEAGMQVCLCVTTAAHEDKILCVMLLGDSDDWLMFPWRAAVPMDQFAMGSPDPKGVLGTVTGFMPELVRTIAEHERLASKQQFWKMATVPLLEFCEALTCTNIRTETIQRADASLNARRIRDGKLPLYETKVLTVATQSQNVPLPGHPGSDGDRASPRQHLRRGHIRRLQTGKNIWINSMLVGHAELGRINKTYRIQK